MMPMYSLIEHSDNYWKSSGALWKQYRDKPNYDMKNSASFKFKGKITWETPIDVNIKNVEIVVSLKYLSNF